MKLRILIIFIFFFMPLASAVPHVALSDDTYFILMENNGLGSYSPKITYRTTVSMPHEISVADLNKDEINDVIVNHWQEGKFTVFWGARENEETSFTEQVFDVGRTGEMHAIGVGDFNEDGLTDLALVDNEDSLPKSVVIAINKGNKEFSEYRRFELSGNQNARTIEINDFNNDNNLDFIVPYALNNIYNIGFGDGQGNFNVQRRTSGNNLHVIESGDVDNDSDNDIAFAQGITIGLFINDGTGEFSRSEILTAGQTGDFLTSEIADYNDDGLLDIAAIKRSGLYVWHGSGNGFEAKQFIRWEFDRVNDIETADVNGDGKKDLVVGVLSIPGTSNAVGGIGVFRNKGDGTFFSSAYFEAGTATRGANQIMIDVYEDNVREEPKFVRGDVDGTGRVSLSDANRILLFLFQGRDELVLCKDAADADDDGRITLTDAIKILNHLFQGGTAPPQPYPERGIDPTPDELGC